MNTAITIMVIFALLTIIMLFLSLMKGSVDGPVIPDKVMTYKDYKFLQTRIILFRIRKKQEWYLEELKKKNGSRKRGFDLKKDEEPDWLEAEYRKWKDEAFEIYHRWEKFKCAGDYRYYNVKVKCSHVSVQIKRSYKEWLAIEFGYFPDMRFFEEG